MEYEQELHDKTFKEEGLDIGRRVFYTLRDVPQIQADRNSTLLAKLTEHLCNAGLLTGEQLDTMLFETTR